MRHHLQVVIMIALLGCTRPTSSLDAVPRPEPGHSEPECLEPPLELGRDRSRPLAVTPCAPTLEPPKLDLAARARALETIHALGIEDPHSALLAYDVAFAELAAANWDGLDNPEVHARLRSMLAWLEPIVDAEAHANSSIQDSGLLALVCTYTLLDEPGPASARARQLLQYHSGMWAPAIYLELAELSSEQNSAITYYRRVAMFVTFESYAKYRLAWALRHPTIIDQAQAVQLLEEVLVAPEAWPRLDRALRHRAALELRELGREVEVPPLRCGAQE